MGIKKEEDNEEKDNEKVDTTDGETRLRVIISAMLGVFGSLTGGEASMAKALNNSKAATLARGAATSRSRDGTGSRTVSRSAQL